MSSDNRRLESATRAGAGAFRRVGKLAGRAASTGYALGMRLPGAREASRGVQAIERAALTELRRRLEATEDPYLAAVVETNGAGSGPVGAHASGELTRVEPHHAALAVGQADGEIAGLRVAMAELLERSISYSRDRARGHLYAVTLRQLTPDEARILSVLASSEPFPALDVLERTGIAGSGRVLLRNASTVGKSAGVTLPEHVPSYLTRLAGLGLVDIGENIPSQDSQYEILLTDQTVRMAEESVKRVRFVRRSVRLSTFGEQFWAACDPAAR